MTCRPRRFFSNVFKARNDVIVEAVVYICSWCSSRACIFSIYTIWLCACAWSLGSINRGLWFGTYDQQHKRFHMTHTHTWYTKPKTTHFSQFRQHIRGTVSKKPLSCIPFHTTLTQCIGIRANDDMDLVYDHSYDAAPKTKQRHHLQQRQLCQSSSSDLICEHFVS